MTDIAGQTKKIHIESGDFNSPFSESLLNRLGASINGLLNLVSPVGTIIYSMLSEAQFQGETSNDWVLSDGRSVAGSAYQSLTGDAFVPDLRGVFLRGKLHDRPFDPTGVGSMDESGDSPLGTYRDFIMILHTHDLSEQVTRLVDGTVEFAFAPDVEKHDPTELLAREGPPRETTTIAAGSTGSTTIGSELAPRCVILNAFIKIN